MTPKAFEAADSAPFDILYCHGRIACVPMAHQCWNKAFSAPLRSSRAVKERQPARQGMAVYFQTTRELGNPAKANGKGDPRFGRLFRSGWSATPPESKIHELAARRDWLAA
jgi:hypothetical protein